MKTHKKQVVGNHPNTFSTTETSCNLTSDFWNNFFETVWEKKTFVKKIGFVTPPISPEDLFKVAVDMSDLHLDLYHGQNIRDGLGIRMTLDGKQLMHDYGHLLPKLTDGDFGGYRKRINRIFPGVSFVFQIDEIAMPSSMKVWTQDFLKGLYRSSGVMSTGHVWMFFFGDYSVTPKYGVHDHVTSTFSESGFYFPLVGKKEILTWTPSYANENTRLKGTLNFDDHLDASTSLLAESNGMMYWPSNRWHVGSSGGGDVSVAFGYRTLSDIYPMFLYSLADLGMFYPYLSFSIRAKLCKTIESFLLLKHIILLKCSARARENQVLNLPINPDDLQGCAKELPEGIKKLGRRANLRRYFGDHIEKVLSIFWLYHLSNLGVDSPNVAFSPLDLKPELQITKSPGVVLLWRQVDSETIILVADRYALEMPVSFSPMVEFVATRQVGQEAYYKELVDSVSTKKIPLQELEKQLVSLLTFLGESGTYTDS